MAILLATSAGPYRHGEKVQCTATFVRDPNNVNTVIDPGTIVFKYAPAGGATTTLTYANAQITKVRAGVYRVTFTVTNTGTQDVVWTYRWESTDNANSEGQGAADNTFVVKPSSL